ncbi:hypothetical protein BO86DRAFT_96461 [Aspergillus japonicus CBS 114.51]|uniref:Uncharacterized protein n=1 Tax=Aspergillus japonicus CBS 114.51 TaxID=1448312 RepID=A0A8T8X0L9_ASPJA|nr:hypothetical protein BO86DRAFT_96461 [Aspergillus japonicus CBS 114.51]RAH81678.1 hypothetical protein BO86DRAFT_96461 [Aspergillus japonicus CBS 114.51]
MPSKEGRQACRTTQQHNKEYSNCPRIVYNRLDHELQLALSNHTVTITLLPAQHLPGPLSPLRSQRSSPPSQRIDMRPSNEMPSLTINSASSVWACGRPSPCHDTFDVVIHRFQYGNDTKIRHSLTRSHILYCTCTQHNKVSISPEIASALRHRQPPIPQTPPFNRATSRPESQAIVFP